MLSLSLGGSTFSRSSILLSYLTLPLYNTLWIPLNLGELVSFAPKLSLSVSVTLPPSQDSYYHLFIHGNSSLALPDLHLPSSRTTYQYCMRVQLHHHQEAPSPPSWANRRIRARSRRRWLRWFLICPRGRRFYPREQHQACNNTDKCRQLHVINSPLLCMFISTIFWKQALSFFFVLSLQMLSMAD